MKEALASVKKRVVRASKKADVAKPLPKPKERITRKVAARKKKVVLSEDAVIIPDNISEISLTQHKKKLSQTDEVVLPRSASVRTVAKAHAIAEIFDRDFNGAMYKIAYVMSVCLMLLGCGMLLMQPQLSGSRLVAQLPMASSSQPIAPYTITTPTVKLTQQLPPTMTQPERFEVQVSNVQIGKVRGAMLPVGGGQPVTSGILTDDRGNGEFRITVPGDGVPYGKYNYGIVMNYFNGISTTTNTFYVGVVEAGIPITLPSPITSSTTPPVVDDTSSSGSSGTSGTSGSTSGGTSSTDGTSSSTTTTNTTSQTTTTSTDEDFEITLASNTFRGFATLIIEAPTSAKFVEIYLRPKSSVTPQFLGLAEYRLGQWRYVFDSTKRPNGDYILFASTKDSSGTLIKTTGESVKIDNPILSVTTTPTQTTTTATPTPVPSDTTTPTEPVSSYEPAPTNQISYPPREFYTVTDEDGVNDGEDSTTEKPIENTVERVAYEEQNRLVTENRTELNELLKRYAVAQQSGDPVLIEAAEKLLREQRESLETKALLNSGTKDVAHEIGASLEEKFEDLKKRVVAFENLRKERSTENLSNDSDSDGVTNYDEVNIFGTDPDSVDSDGDGFNDGVEILRGYDPKSDASEAVIRYESPREVIAPVREDVLAVEAVLPVIQQDTEIGLPPVMAEIRGKALPNSFVTLYIFSTPTIVTVKADADGSFVYTFEKELEDGEHEVYVAVTDNAGVILAQSNPFTFVKEAQAFTPVDAAEASVVTSEPLSETVSGSSYSMVAGLGILALGFILLMLGISLRTKEDEVVVTVKGEAKDTPAP